MPILPKSAPRAYIAAQPKPAYKPHTVRTPLYDSPLWRRIRADHLRRHPLCVACQRKDQLTTASILDHIIPVREGADFFDVTNLQGLCRTCHYRKSAREGQARKRANRANP